MKVQAINFDADEAPESVVVEMTTNEAALLYAFLGHISPQRVTEASGDVKWGNALYDAADCLSGAFFNRLWDSGWDEVGPRTLRIATLQGEGEVIVAPTRGAEPNHVHACLTCAPDAATPGPGCANCRQTGYDQTPCVDCPTGGAE